MQRIQVDLTAVAILFKHWLNKPVKVEETDHGILISIRSASALATWNEIRRAQYTTWDFEQLMKKKKMKLVFQLKKEKANG